MACGTMVELRFLVNFEYEADVVRHQVGLLKFMRKEYISIMA